MTENEHVREVFSNRLKMLRKEKKIKQEQLAEALNIGKSSVGNYEIGTRLPDADVVVALADYFNVSADYLLGRVNDRLTTVDSADKVIKSLSERVEALSRTDTGAFYADAKEHLYRILSCVEKMLDNDGARRKDDYSILRVYARILELLAGFDESAKGILAHHYGEHKKKRDMQGYDYSNDVDSLKRHYERMS
jgi:transcriptional regulator with XRE-family HTH domain